MISTVVNVSELGTECWSALRLCGVCYKCIGYAGCKYSCKVRNEEIDNLLQEKEKFENDLRDVHKRIRELMLSEESKIDE